MKKIMTKIVGAFLGVAMTIGVGVGIAVDQNASAVYAVEDTANLTLTSKNNISASASFPFSVAYSGTWTWSSPQVRTTDTAATVTFTGDSTVAYIKSIVIGCSSAGYAPAGSANNSYTTSVSGSNVTISGTNAASVVWTPGAAARLKTYSITYEKASAGTVTSVTIIGDMTKKSYTTVEKWSNAGLTATATMSDSSTYLGQYSWTYFPTTPASVVLGNNLESATNETVSVKATAGGEYGEIDVSGITVNLANVAELTAATPASGTISDVIAKGIVSQVDSLNSNKSITYYISDDGTTINQYKVYQGKNLDSADFANINDLRVGDIVIVCGDITTYNSTKEFNAGNYLVGFERPASTEPSVEIAENDFTMVVGQQDADIHVTAENIPEGGSLVVESSLTSVATIVEDNGAYSVHAVAPGSSTITAKIVNSGAETVASYAIIVKVTKNELANGDTFIIKADHEGTTYYMTGVSSNLGTASTNRNEAMIFTAVEIATPGQFQFKNGNDYLSYSGSSNNIYTTTDATSNTTIWTALNDGSKLAIENCSVEGRVIKYNYNNNQPRFACYTTASTMTWVEIEKVVAPEVDEVTVVGDASVNANDALSVTKVFEYEVTYVDSANQGNSAITVSVLNSSNTTEGASVTVAPLNGEFSVTFTANGVYTITITSAEDESKSASTTISVYNIHVAALEDYNLYSGTTLVEGDYVFYFDGRAMKAEIASNRTKFEAVTPVNDVISTEDASIIWHVAPNGEYYTIFNALENKYLASTTSNNQAKLESEVTDYSLWTVENTNGQLDFINKARASVNNKYLRCNNDYGFACYATGTGGKPSLYKRSAKNIVEGLNTQTSLAYRYEKDGEGNFTYSDIVMRFGANISEDLWNELDTDEHNITGFGVILMDGKAIKDMGDVADAMTDMVLSSNPSELSTHSAIDCFVPIANMNETIGSDDNNYFWNLRVSVAQSEMNKAYAAVAYIKLGDEYVLLNMANESVETLALDYMVNRGCDETTAGGSLQNIIDKAA